MKAEYVTIEIEIEQTLLEQIRPILAAEGLTVEQSIVLFFQWCVECPERAKNTILEWQKQLADDG